MGSAAVCSGLFFSALVPKCTDLNIRFAHFDIHRNLDRVRDVKIVVRFNYYMSRIKKVYYYDLTLYSEFLSMAGGNRLLKKQNGPQLEERQITS